MSVLGCSGQTSGVWDYDQHAEEVEVWVSDGEERNTQQIRFEARFSTYADSYSYETTTQTVSGTVEVHR